MGTLARWTMSICTMWEGTAVLEYSGEASRRADTLHNRSPMPIPQASSLLETGRSELDGRNCTFQRPLPLPFARKLAQKKNLCDWSQTLRHFS
jgi:hypothetical protein